MKTPIIIVLLLILAGLVTGGAFLYSQQQKVATSDQSLSQQEPTTNDFMAPTDSQNVMTDKEDMMIETKGSKYIKYIKLAFDNNTEKRRVLFFYANWCPTCRPADANFIANVDKIPDDAVVIRVNYNDDETDAEEKALAEQYGVTYQHTFVQIDKDGNEVAKWNGGQIEELLENIK